MGHGKAETDPSSVRLEHDAAAQAALMLLESVILVLLNNGIVSRLQIVEAIEMVIEAKRDLAEDGVHPKVSLRAAGMLSIIANSIAASSQGRRRKVRRAGSPKSL
ncbi:hypothetical protein KXR53_32395 [Inquilinus limosus]|uniref:hypothetical protein n=1 Tax=Inquilinus limosus TaxID=171674 RepID=UPI003F138D5C